MRRRVEQSRELAALRASDAQQRLENYQNFEAANKAEATAPMESLLGAWVV
jgi:hypothetical protein